MTDDTGILVLGVIVPLLIALFLAVSAARSK